MNQRVVMAIVFVCTVLLFRVVSAQDTATQSPSPDDLLAQLNDYPHAQLVAQVQVEVLDHEIGLGAMKKIRGVWQFKSSERYDGLLTRYTWQVIDGFTSAEVARELLSQLQQRDDVNLVFNCQGRACGSSAQWASRVFRQRILYGREDLQQYAVYSLGQKPEYRLVVYSAARTADRQYLHVELLELTD